MIPSLRLFLALISILITSISSAAEPAWQVTDRGGTVLMLRGDKWDYLPEGAAVERGVAIRTLKRSRIRLQFERYAVELGPNTAVRFEPSDPSSVIVTHFAGLISVTLQGAKGRRLLVNTPAMAIYVEPGSASLTIGSETGKVTVASGVVTVLDVGTKSSQRAGAGHTVVVSATSPAGNDAVGNNNPNAGGGGNAGGNGGGNGNAGGNGGGNNNAGGNSGGGNAGGNSGGGNAGGNAGGNPGGGNAGGNSGGGNAGGNGNGGGAGNGNSDSRQGNSDSGKGSAERSSGSAGNGRGNSNGNGSSNKG